eukprot:11248992-Karenia_brevis.AAC.1
MQWSQPAPKRATEDCRLSCSVSRLPDADTWPKFSAGEIDDGANEHCVDGGTDSISSLLPAAGGMGGQEWASGSRRWSRDDFSGCH